mmetsp:Transcript_8263/g.16476  ORF Transcript_8263/g.16476 Transcript_8263/m.16476 type:complete len:227 (+) Transcript_8263:549-1229(+)
MVHHQLRHPVPVLLPQHSLHHRDHPSIHGLPLRRARSWHEEHPEPRVVLLHMPTESLVEPAPPAVHDQHADLVRRLAQPLFLSLEVRNSNEVDVFLGGCCISPMVVGQANGSDSTLELLRRSLDLEAQCCLVVSERFRCSNSDVLVVRSNLFLRRPTVIPTRLLVSHTAHLRQRIRCFAAEDDLHWQHRSSVDSIATRRGHHSCALTLVTVALHRALFSLFNDLPL